MAKRVDPLASVNLLELRPTRSADWREVEGKVVIERPRPAAGGLRAAAEWLTFLMSTRHIRLDDKGSYAWKRLDGSRSIERLAQEMRAEFGAAIEPAEERLGLLIRQLRSQDLVAYPGWDEGGGSSAPGRSG